MSNYRETEIHLSKREDMPVWKQWMIRLAAVMLSLVVCGVVIYCLTNLNPIRIYQSIADGAVGTQRRAWNTIRDTMVLLCVSLAVTPAFKMRFWNIGAEGQVLMGCVASAAVMIYGGSMLPGPVLLVVMFAVSILAGLVWGLIPAFFKAQLGTNETLFTLMLNYVAIQFVNFCIVFWENPPGSNNVGIINGADRAGWMPPVLGLEYGGMLILVLLLVVFLDIYLKRTKHGYEIAVVGESENTAKYAGIHVKKVILRTMAISGGLCGITGFLLVSATSHTISANIAGGRGFTAIIVAWLARFNVYVMILISFLLIFMQKGAMQIASQYNLNESASDVLIGIILFFIIGCEFFVQYKLERVGKQSVTKDGGRE